MIFEHWVSKCTVVCHCQAMSIASGSTHFSTCVQMFLKLQYVPTCRYDMPNKPVLFVHEFIDFLFPVVKKICLGLVYKVKVYNLFVGTNLWLVWMVHTCISQDGENLAYYNIIPTTLIPLLSMLVCPFRINKILLLYSKYLPVFSSVTKYRKKWKRTCIVHVFFSFMVLEEAPCIKK